MTVSALVFDGEGQVLLGKRVDNGRWVLPGGFADVGPTPAESVLRELWEEAGLRGRVERLLGVFDGRIWDPTAGAHQISLLFEPEDLAPWQELRLREAVHLRRESAAYFDPADSRRAEMPAHQRLQE